MGFIMFCLLTWVLGMAFKGIITDRDERAKAIKSVHEQPLQHAFLFVWLGCIYAFVIGVFAPVIGEVEVFETGWAIWQVGGIGSLIGLVVYWTLNPFQ